LQENTPRLCRSFNAAVVELALVLKSFNSANSLVHFGSIFPFYFARKHCSLLPRMCWSFNAAVVELVLVLKSFNAANSLVRFGNNCFVHFVKNTQRQCCSCACSSRRAGSYKILQHKNSLVRLWTFFSCTKTDNCVWHWWVRPKLIRVSLAWPDIAIVELLQLLLEALLLRLVLLLALQVVAEPGKKGRRVPQELAKNFWLPTFLATMYTPWIGYRDGHVWLSVLFQESSTYSDWCRLLRPPSQMTIICTIIQQIVGTLHM
jgi:hypothetical protein